MQLIDGQLVRTSEDFVNMPQDFKNTRIVVDKNIDRTRIISYILKQNPDIEDKLDFIFIMHADDINGNVFEHPTQDAINKFADFLIILFDRGWFHDHGFVLE